METIVTYATLSTSLRLTQDPESKRQLSNLYQTTNWQKSTKALPLKEVLALNELVTIKTDSIWVIDFDCDRAFSRALTFNQSLSEEHQCGLIVKSSRKGGHFYYLPNPSVELTPGHTKQQVLDILTTGKHNAIAPTVFDEGKHIIHMADKLTPYNLAFNTLVSNIVLENLPLTARNITLYDKNNRHSDNAKDLIKSYLSNITTQAQFDEFYNIPSPIPSGGSNEVYLSLSTRLGSDESISKEDYLSAIAQFNSYHQRKTTAELRNEITNRMIPPQCINGLWRYDPVQAPHTFTVTHKKHKTLISVYYDMLSGEYLLYHLSSLAQPVLHTLRNTTTYLDLIEKITLVKKDTLRRKTNEIQAVSSINDYTMPSGYSQKTETFNKAFINSNLTAFYGTKPADYEQPIELLELMQYMWGEEYQYLLDITKHRYTTFQFSPVVTYLKGTEGSGKDLTIALLTGGFSDLPQSLNYQLLKDKHSNWQTTPNAVFSEIGSWRQMERDDLLSELKTISGSNGKVTFRDMQRTAQVVPTMIKIWITGNEWVKLHTDPLTQRRVHVVYMPRPLETDSGGPYSAVHLQEILSPENILNFYYYLGNDYKLSAEFTVDRYKNARSRQHTESYETYIENTQSKADVASDLLYSQDYTKLLRAFSMFNVTLQDTDYKYAKSGNLVISLGSLKSAFGRNSGGDSINKTLDRVSSEKDGNKKLVFTKYKEKYITIYGAPAGLETVEGIDV